MDALPRPLLSVVVHEVSPVHWESCQRLLAAIRDVADIPVTLLVVPRLHLRPSDPGFEHALTELRWQGHELALHGYNHLDQDPDSGRRRPLLRPWMTRGDGEFARLCESAALLKILAGARWFQRNQWPLHGFVAPSWRLSEGTWQALRRLTLSYTATQSQVHHLPDESALDSDCLVYDSTTRWRRMISVPRNAMVAAGWSDHPLVRLELRPGDADHPLVRRSWTRLLARELDQREAMTLANAMAKLRQVGHPPRHDIERMEQPRTVPSAHRVVVPFARPQHDAAAAGPHPTAP